MARHLMQPDPDAEAPPLAFVLWLVALVLAIVLVLAVAAPTD
ncbi:MAG TPA: hypothetical protein VJ814_01225 [Gaiellaceae bacterium]|nr:hypothetical protein [Gaiellaceae bacterium]